MSRQIDLGAKSDHWLKIEREYANERWLKLYRSSEKGSERERDAYAMLDAIGGEILRRQERITAIKWTVAILALALLSSTGGIAGWLGL